MPERILGLDIGTRSIKAVQVTAALKGYEVNDYRLIDIAEAGSMENALAALFEDDITKNSVCITALPIQHFSFRSITLPFRDRKKISQTIPFELEPLIPYPLDDAAIDYLMISQKEQSNILTAVIPRSEIRSLSGLFEAHRIEASIIDINSVAVALKLIEGGLAPGCCLLLDIGAVDTACILIDAGKICHVRIFDFGNETIAAGDADTDGHTTQNIRQFFKDVENTIRFLALKGECETDIEALYLTGGGALNPHLRSEIDNFFAVPVVPVDITTTDNISFGEDAGHDWNPMIMNHALALATRPTKKAGGFNFAMGEFGPKKKYVKFRKDIIWVTVLTACALLLAGIDLFIDYHYDRKYLHSLKQEINTVFKETAPDITRIVDPVQQLKVRITEARKSSAGSGTLNFETNVITILNDISRIIPAHIDFLITNFTYDGQTIEVKGETNNFNTVDTIKNALAASPYYTDVKISSANLIKKGSRIGFDLRMILKQ